MKKSKIFMLLFMIVIITCVLIYNKQNKTNHIETENDYETTTSESTVIVTDIENAISSSTYVETALEEKKSLHATYYFQEIYVKENQLVNAGENILQYTNGTYMTAPYNCVITEISIPSSGEMCTNEHYITIQSTDSLKVSLSVDEDEINKIYLGQEAEITLEALSDTTITGYITNIDSTATYDSNGSTFGIEVEFQNDDNILLGMSAKCSIVLEKAENVIAVATEAIDEQNGEEYVTLKTSDDKTTEVQVKTGISNDAYTEITSGLNEGDIVVIEKEESSSNNNNRMNGPGGDMDSRNNGGGMPDMKQQKTAQ